jgi:hypothetical protein
VRWQSFLAEFWLQKKSPWLIGRCRSFSWVRLAGEGPLHLFFYGVVIAIVWKERNWRVVSSGAPGRRNFDAGMFAAWAIRSWRRRTGPLRRQSGRSISRAPARATSIWPLDLQHSAWRSLFITVGDFSAAGALRKFCGREIEACPRLGVGRARSVCGCQSCAGIDSALRNAGAHSGDLVTGDDFL